MHRDLSKVSTMPGNLSASPGFLSPSRMDISAQTASPASTTRSPASGSPKSSRREVTHPLPAELQGVSVKELVKALGKCVRYTAAHTCFNLSWSILSCSWISWVPAQVWKDLPIKDFLHVVNFLKLTFKSN